MLLLLFFVAIVLTRILFTPNNRLSLEVTRLSPSVLRFRVNAGYWSRPVINTKRFPSELSPQRPSHGPAAREEGAAERATPTPQAWEHNTSVRLWTGFASDLFSVLRSNKSLKSESPPSSCHHARSRAGLKPGTSPSRPPPPPPQLKLVQTSSYQERDEVRKRKLLGVDATMVCLCVVTGGMRVSLP